MNSHVVKICMLSIVTYQYTFSTIRPFDLATYLKCTFNKSMPMSHILLSMQHECLYLYCYTSSIQTSLYFLIFFPCHSHKSHCFKVLRTTIQQRLLMPSPCYPCAESSCNLPTPSNRNNMANLFTLTASRQQSTYTSLLSHWPNKKAQHKKAQPIVSVYQTKNKGPTKKPSTIGITKKQPTSLPLPFYFLVYISQCTVHQICVSPHIYSTVRSMVPLATHFCAASPDSIFSATQILQPSSAY